MDLTRNVNSDPRRAIPSVNRLTDQVRGAAPEIADWIPARAAQRAIDEVRERLMSRGESAVPVEAAEVEQQCLDAALDHAAKWAMEWPRPVLNATGVTLHTNLGRAPMAEGAAQAAAEAAMGYTNLELDLESGERGNRIASVTEKLCHLSGAEGAYVCNNNAAAVMLALNSLAAGQEVVVSRGELVEIGGSFRVPEVMKKAGVELREVGSTNRTHAHDYASAIGPRTGMLLKVHRSNFEQTGFVKEVSLAELVSIGAEHGVPVVEDLGSGSLLDLSSVGVPAEAHVLSRLQMGPDVVCFSGDKLFGGPQAGLILGKKDSIALMKQNPLARALRLDKMALSALDFTLSRMLDGSAPDTIPVLRQLMLSQKDHEARTRRWAARLESAVAERGGSLGVEWVEETVPVGGGSLPGFDIQSCALAIKPEVSASQFAARLRHAPVPTLSRIRDQRILLDLRAIGEDQEDDLIQGILSALH
jgi:L-seryl-tRNA(Ser) seleniumtransferase